jgi:hypothetical protein
VDISFRDDVTGILLLGVSEGSIEEKRIKERLIDRREGLESQVKERR